MMKNSPLRLIFSVFPAEPMMLCCTGDGPGAGTAARRGGFSPAKASEVRASRPLFPVKWSSAAATGQFSSAMEILPYSGSEAGLA